MPPNVIVGQRLRKLRTEKRLSTEQLAKAIHKKTGYKRSGNLYEKMELGQARPTIEALFALAEFYDTDMNTILGSRSPYDLSGLEFLAKDQDLVDELAHFRLNLGEEMARRALRELMRVVNLLSDHLLSRRKQR